MIKASKGLEAKSENSNFLFEVFGLKKIGAKKIKKIHYNLPISSLIETSIKRGESFLANNGALVVKTGKFTGRSPKDKFTVNQNPSNKKIWWGEINQKISQKNWNAIKKKVVDYLNNKETFIFDGYVGNDKKYRIPVRVISEFAWHSLFCQTLLVRPPIKNFRPHKNPFTIIDVGKFLACGKKEGLRQNNFTVVNFEKNMALIGGSEYAGEMKKSAFYIMNFLLPQKNVFPMHCSANMGKKNDTALFFGLSGTGKTTLSSDVDRRLIGDDEHGWSNSGIFNFEGGCYAKTINLRRENEPQIWDAIRFGSVLENVIVNPKSRDIDYDDDSITENTRATYPTHFIDNSVLSGCASHPKNIFFLTCDAFGVIPPISKLNSNQAVYHFLSGYTAKVAGTEAGVNDPEATFSTCFGAPFLPLHPTEYGKMLEDKIKRYRTKIWLINTGWIGGSAGTVNRIHLKYTRAMIKAAISGKLDKTPTIKSPFFGLEIPVKCEGVPANLLVPKKSWKSELEYNKKSMELASAFRENFKAFGDKVELKIIKAGPK
ncbi:MAG: phosphoenolpyruvate carboxykinase (ATP) [Nitrospinota bacterium]|nr:phosphoenolpyruvate carboxykinase (ATP) [Nitrospinota bacterium]